MYAKVCNDSLNIAIVMGSRKYYYTLAWDIRLTPEIYKYGHRPLHVKHRIIESDFRSSKNFKQN